MAARTADNNDDDDDAVANRAKLKRVSEVMREKRYYNKHKCAIWVVAAGIVVGACATAATLIAALTYVATGARLW